MMDYQYNPIRFDITSIEVACRFISITAWNQSNSVSSYRIRTKSIITVRTNETFCIGNFSNGNWKQFDRQLRYYLVNELQSKKCRAHRPHHCTSYLFRNEMEQKKILRNFIDFFCLKNACSPRWVECVHSVSTKATISIGFVSFIFLFGVCLSAPV